jgi:hypothetical protein
MKKMIRYLRRQQKIFAPGRELRLDYDTTMQIDEDIQLIIMSGKAKDPIGAARLLDEYKVETAAELIPLLPKRKRPSIKARLLRWVQRLLGLYPTDPTLESLKRRDEMPKQHGVTLTRLR